MDASAVWSLVGLSLGFFGFAVIMVSGGLSYHPKMQRKGDRLLRERRKEYRQAAKRGNALFLGILRSLPRNYLELMHYGNRFGFFIVLAGFVCQFIGELLGSL